MYYSNTFVFLSVDYYYYHFRSNHALLFLIFHTLLLPMPLISHSLMPLVFCFVWMFLSLLSLPSLPSLPSLLSPPSLPSLPSLLSFLSFLSFLWSMVVGVAVVVFLLVVPLKQWLFDLLVSVYHTPKL